jgi:hypothetical protein
MKGTQFNYKLSAGYDDEHGMTFIRVFSDDILVINRERLRYESLGYTTHLECINEQMEVSA